MKVIAIFIFMVFTLTGIGEINMGESFVWETAPPESCDMSKTKLDELKDILASRGTKTFLVIRHDKIVYEWYAADYGIKSKHYTASLAKSIVGGMSLMVALNDGLINVDDPAWKYIPAWKDDPQKSKITIRHLATHSSGVEDAEYDNLPHDQLPGWKGNFWKQDPDPFTISRDQAPIIFPPGTSYAYSNPGMGMLAYAVTASIHNAPQSDILTLLRERIMRPIGVPDDDWQMGYGRPFDVDGLKLYANWGGGSYTARAVASVGRLMLHKGNWDGKQLVSPEWVERMVAYAETPIAERSDGNPNPASGLCWWTNFDGVWSSVPKDAYAGAGAGNQVLFVVPSLDLIVVRNGSNLFSEKDGEGFWGGLEKYLFTPVCQAIANEIPQSPVIKGVRWSPPESIIRQATGKNKDGSDNFPITWADDGNIYTAYGDGYGFDPIVPDKLGLGFARIKGDSDGFVGENIRSDAENSGMGKSGKKASGLLMVDGVLYMWLRNADNNGHHCQLAWSKDYAKTWAWADWKFEELGYMTFINFGKNYGGVPEKHKDYVYMVSHDNPSAYESSDSFVLARAPKDKIKDRGAYEFLKEVSENGDPIWTDDIQERNAVFTNSGRCRRSGISYNAGLKRYLWWQQDRMGDADTRFSGGFGIYDAPEPWGPWTKAYHTENWDVGPGETACFPTKWMSDDGKTCYLVFSGNDNFSVREVIFEINE